MQSKPCGHYLPEAELIVVSGAPLVIRIPVRRCLLSERMIAQIAQTESGLAVARKLTFASTTLPQSAADETSETSAEELPYPIRAALGPDLEPIHRDDCLEARCLESCTPGYVAMLAQFGVSMATDDDPGRGCLETSARAEEIP